MPCRMPVDRSVSCRLVLGALAMAADAAAQNCPTMRKINIGVSVAPPNVVHTSPYVAKDARLLRQALHRRQHHPVRGRPVGDLGGGGRAGHRDRQRQRRRDRPRPEGAADLGARAAHAAGLHGAGATSRPRPISRASGCRATGGGVGGFNWRMGREVLKSAGLDGRRRAVHLLGHRRPAARPGRRPDRRRRAASRGRLPRARSRSRRLHLAGAARRPDAALHVQRLWRLDRLDRARPRAAARHRRRDDRGQPHDLPRQGQGRADHRWRRPRSRRRRSSTPGTSRPRTASGRSTTGFDRKRTQWTIDNSVENGDIDADKKPTVEQVANMKLAEEARGAAGGPVTIGNCTD